MRATAPVVLVAVCFWAVCLFAGSAQAATRILVTPIPGSAKDDTARTLTRAVETAIAAAVDEGEIVTPQALDTAVEIAAARDCVGDDNSAVVSSCLSELADAIDVEFIARPSLGRLGSELVLTLTLLDGARAVVVAQAQRRADASSPEALLDQIPGLAKEVAKAADIAATGKKKRTVPVAAIGVSVGGAVVAAVGAVALGVRGSLAGDYEDGDLDRDDARAYEAIDAPFLFGGIGSVVVGGAVALAGAGFAVWSVIAPEE